jgi:uncharacterized surface protein with fasciclin (FAS1) repeats
MKHSYLLPVAFATWVMAGCQQQPSNQSGAATVASTEQKAGQSGVKDDVSNPNIVQVAMGSKDHSTLVAAVKAAGLVDALSNAGPFTVFAPTNAAFDKLPVGTVESLLKPEKKADLENILGYHTYVGVLQGALLQDGMEYDMVYGGKIKISRKGEQILVNNQPVVASISASNGTIYVIEAVMLPPSK